MEPLVTVTGVFLHYRDPVATEGVLYYSFVPGGGTASTERGMSLVVVTLEKCFFLPFLLMVFLMSSRVAGYY